MLTDRANLVAAWATGIGVGLLAFMIMWLLGARVAARIWGPPSGAIIAMLVALTVGAATALVVGRKLARSERTRLTTVQTPVGKA